MPHITFTRRFVFLFLTGFLFGWFISAPNFAQTSSEDEASLRRFIENYFAIYKKRELDELLKLWSEKSPDLASNKKTLQESFAKINKIELKGLSLRKIMLDAGKARVQLSIEISAVDAKSEKPVEGFGKMNRTLYLVKESGQWKIWQNLISEEDLAIKLVEAKTEGERRQLLEAEQELVTVTLVQALIAQGRSLFVQSRYSQALTIYTVTGEIANQLNDKKSLVTALRGIGNVYRAQRNYTKALDYFYKSLKIAQENNDLSGIAMTLNNIGSVYYNQENYTQALEYYQKGLELSEKINDKLGIGGTLHNIGLILQHQNKFTQALEYQYRSLKIAEDLGHKDLMGITLHNLGAIQQHLGNYRQASEYYYRSLKFREETGNKAGIANLLINLGNVQDSQGNHVQALDYYHKSLKIAEEISDQAAMALSLNNIGLIHQQQGNYAQALEYYDKSLKIAEDINNKAGIATVFISIGSAYQSQGKFTPALEYYQKSLKIKEELGDKAGTCITLYSMGSLYQCLKKYKEAVEYANRAADIAYHIGSPLLIWESQIVAGRAYQALNQPDEAKKTFAEAISAIEGTRNQFSGGEQEQQQFFDGKLWPYRGMISLLINQNNAVDAFAFVEHAKARTLLDVLQTGKLNITKAMNLAEKQQEQTLNSELISLNAQIYKEKLLKQQDSVRLNDLNVRLQKVRLEMEAFQTSLYASHPELQIHRGQAQTITLSEATALIPDSKTTLLEFVVSEDQTYIFTLTKSTSQSTPDLKVYKIDIKQKALAKLCSDFRERLAGRLVSYQDLATKLYDLLLKPAYSQLAGKTNLIIIPDGVLWELPFQTLQPARNHFLIEDTAISYAPSLTVLQKMHQTRQNHTSTPATTLLAAGNPIIGNQTSAQVKDILMGEQLQPLPEAERQVKLLQKLYTPSHSKVYIGQQADEATVKAEAGNSRILQLATHGILNDVNPMYSQIVLAHNDADTNEDGLLEAWEIMNIDLKADLVVLSACETARGKVGAGEGMIGLAWAFFVAGSPTTVVSQWKVESASTTELMVAFHKNLQMPTGKQNPKMTKAEALRQAALKLMKTQAYKHPFYWAAFVVIGDAS